MNLLKSIGNLVFGKKDETLVSINSGQFFYLSPRDTNSKQMLFRDAECSVKRTSLEFQYQLTITRVFEEGESENGEDLDEHTFLIDPCLLFRIATSNDKTPSRMIWADVDDPTGMRGWEFVVDTATTQIQVSLFEETLFSCMYERVHSIAHNNSQESHRLEFITEMQAKGASSNVGIWNKQPKVVAQTPKGEKAITRISQSASSTKKLESILIPAGTKLISQAAQLCRFDTISGDFVLIFNLVQVQVIQIGTFAFNLVVVDQESHNCILSLPITQQMNPVYHPTNQSFIWVTYDLQTGQPMYSEMLKFNPSKPEDGARFNEMICKCLYESLTNSLFSKVNAADQSYLCHAYQDVAMQSASEEEEDEEVDSPKVIGEDEMAAGSTSGIKNSHLAIGYKNDRSFVVRGNRIGVFKNTQDSLEFSTTINNVSTAAGKSFTPSKIMLHQQDSCMLMMNPADSHTVYKMDLEYGKVVDEWKVILLLIIGR